MSSSIYCYDPIAGDPLSRVRGVGRYLQILRENFSHWTFANKSGMRNSELRIFINPFFNFLQPPLSIRRIAKKQVAIIHDLIPLKYPEHFPAGIKGKINIFLNKLVLKHYDSIVTDSEASKKDIVRILGINEDKVKVIYPCLPKIFSNSKLVIRDSEKQKQENPNYQLPVTNYCIYVGDATWNKNLVNLARAIKEINVTCVFVGKVCSNSELVISNLDKQNNPNYQLPVTSYSNPWQKELKQFIEEAKNDKRFIFPGFIPDEELMTLYRNAKCNILVSRDEGFGFSYLEAASQSCPSILSGIPTLKEISDSKGALFAPPEKVSDIANTIGELYFNRDKRNTLGIEAERQARYYSYSKFTHEWSKIVI